MIDIISIKIITIFCTPLDIHDYTLAIFFKKQVKSLVGEKKLMRS